MTVCGYCRVSTDEQAASSLGLPAQVAAITAEAEGAAAELLARLADASTPPRPPTALLACLATLCATGAVSLSAMGPSTSTAETSAPHSKPPK